MQPIRLKKVRVHNLKGVDLELPGNELVVFTGVSGSGKSSLAFDTLFVEGQRRYVESLSTYARKLLGDLSKPDLDFAEGITPTIAIEQKSGSRNPRSTVGTLTEIYDYLRVLYARIGTPHCPVSGEAVSPQSKERIMRMVQAYPEGTKLIILAPYAKRKKGEFREEFIDLIRKGFTRIRVDGQIVQLDAPISLDGSLAHDIDLVIDRIQAGEGQNSRITEAVNEALNQGSGSLSVLFPDSGEEKLFSMHAYSIQSGLSYEALEPNDFSFNSPQGMCPRCLGLGVVQEFDQAKVIDPDKSISEDCCAVGSSYQTVRYGNIYDNLARIYKFDVHTPWKKLSEEAKKVFLYGTEKKWTKMQFKHPVTGATWQDHVQWRGVLYEAKSRFADATSDLYRNKMLKLMHEEVCPECQGERLKPYPRACTLGGKRIGQASALTVSDLLQFLNRLKLSPQEAIIAEELLKEIKERLRFLIDVGLHYITLDRAAPTLSGGEVQRVRLASQIGCGLVGITYILDEPSIGLHPRDNQKLIATLCSLRDRGNSVVVVEHDEETMLAADRIVDFGPGAGLKGGEILLNGTVEELIAEKKSLTGAFLSGKKEIPIPKKRRKGSKKALKLIGAKQHNLKNIDVSFPLGLFVAVTGVSGSGKSSLVSDILYPALANRLNKADLSEGVFKEIKGVEELDKVIQIDQSPIGRNPRSTPATYIKLFDEIRDLFAALPESKARGFLPGRFSFNVKEGSCTECKGMGMIKIDMDFLEEEWVECPVCRNRRFDQETLSVYYKGKNIYDVLEMDVEEALAFFDALPHIRKKLEMLH
ncbi:MAG: excinuclease ABC subunit UvrA, partial [Parachlamydiaceae bacterium]